MAVLAVGDTTTQLRKWIDANAVGGDVNTKMVSPLQTALTLPLLTDVSALLEKFIAR